MARHPNQTDHRATFTVHPLEGSSRLSLLGLLAVLFGVVSLEQDPRGNK